MWASGFRPGPVECEPVDGYIAQVVSDSFTEHRSLLFGIAYRMLGSATEAEDMVQETWLRWQAQAEGDIRTPKAWLTTAVTRLCIDQLRSAKRQREEYYGVWLPEPLLEAHAPSPADSAALADSLSMAFMLVLETLSPVDRAVFLLREVFDYDYAEIAKVVGKSEASCRQMVHRAKERLALSNPAPQPPNELAQQVVAQFMEATATGEMEDLLALLTDDVVLLSDGGGQVSAAGRPVHSAEAVSRFLLGIRKFRPADTELRYCTLNGRAGVLMLSGGHIYNAATFDLENGRIRSVYIVRNPQKLHRLEQQVGSLASN